MRMIDQQACQRHRLTSGERPQGGALRTKRAGLSGGEDGEPGENQIH